MWLRLTASREVGGDSNDSTWVAAPSLLWERSMVARLGSEERGIGGPDSKLWDRFR